MAMTPGRRDALLKRFDAATRRLVDLLRGIPLDRSGTLVPGLDWTVADTGAHLVSVFRRMTGDARRAFDPSHLVELNDAGIAEVEGGLPAVADEIEARLAAIVDRIPQVPDDRLYPFHFGLQVPATTGLAVVMGEVLVHGWDIARAVGAEMEIDQDDVTSFWRAGLTVLAGCVAPDAGGVDETWSIVMPGEPPVTVVISNGTATIDPPHAGPPDHVVEVEDPVHFMLGFPYGRVELAPPADLLAGRFTIV